MWIATTIGFFSVVEKGDQLCVRARHPAHLDELRKRYAHGLGPTIVGGGTDYPCRALLTRKEWAQALAGLAEEINYTNYKTEATSQNGASYGKALAEAWTALKQLEPKKQISVGTVVLSRTEDGIPHVLLVEPTGRAYGYCYTWPKVRAKSGETCKDAANRALQEKACIAGHAGGRLNDWFVGTETETSYFFMYTDAMAGHAGKNVSAVHWVPLLSARSYLQQTKDPCGRARDLKVLEAVERVTLRGRHLPQGGWDAMADGPIEYRQLPVPRLAIAARGGTRELRFAPDGASFAFRDEEDHSLNQRWQRCHLEDGRVNSLSGLGLHAAFVQSTHGDDVWLVGSATEQGRWLAEHWSDGRPEFCNFNLHGDDIMHCGMSSPVCTSSGRIFRVATKQLQRGRLLAADLCMTRDQNFENCGSFETRVPLRLANKENFLVGATDSHVFVHTMGESSSESFGCGMPEGHIEWMSTASLAPIAAVCSRVIHVVDLQSRRILRTLDYGSKTKLSGDLTPDGEWIVFALAGGLIAHHWLTGRRIRWDDPQKSVSSMPVRISSNGQHLVMGTADQGLRVYALSDLIQEKATQ